MIILNELPAQYKKIGPTLCALGDGSSTLDAAKRRLLQEEQRQDIRQPKTSKPCFFLLIAPAQFQFEPISVKKVSGEV